MIKVLLIEISLFYLNMRDKRLTADGVPIGQASMNIIIKKVAEKIGVNAASKQINMYTCRHTVANKLGNTQE